MRLAIEQGKEIFVTPGNIYDEENAGGNELLREMPHALAISPEDVLDALHVQREVVENSPCSLTLWKARLSTHCTTAKSISKSCLQTRG